MKDKNSYSLVLDEVDHLVVGGVITLQLNIFENNTADIYIDHSPLLNRNIKIRQENHKLYIYTSGILPVAEIYHIILHLPRLKQITIKDNARIHGHYNGKELNLLAKGKSYIELLGDVLTTRLHAMDMAKIKLKKLITRRTHIMLDDNAYAQVGGKEFLSAHLMPKTRLSIIGAPQSLKIDKSTQTFEKNKTIHKEHSALNPPFQGKVQDQKSLKDYIKNLL